MLPSWVRRVLRVVATGGLVFALLAGTARAYALRVYEEPARQALQDLPFVRAVQQVHTGPEGTVIVELAAVPHLREAYLQIERLLAQRAGAAAPRIELRDRRDAQLVDAFYRLRPFVLEAAERGNHSEMAAAFAREAAALGLERPTGFAVDGQRLYVQLHRGDRYLYVVEDRWPEEASP